MRGRQEHHSMKIEHFILKIADGGKEFLTFSEGITKTRQSGLHEKHRLVNPKCLRLVTIGVHFSCSKHIYQNGHYISVLVGLSIYQSLPSQNQIFGSAMGVNTINNLRKTMIKNSPLVGCGKRLINHSARKTVVKKLKSNQVPKSDKKSPSQATTTSVVWTHTTVGMNIIKNSCQISLQIKINLKIRLRILPLFQLF